MSRHSKPRFCLDCGQRKPPGVGGRARHNPVEPHLPGEPLGEAVTREATRRLLPANVFALPGPGDERYDGVSRLAQELHVAPRTVYAWRHGRDVSLDLADAVLTRLGWLWWDVWNEDTVRRPALVVELFARRQKTNGATCRRFIRRELYGDLGPNVAELERIRRVMECEEAIAV